MTNAIHAEDLTKNFGSFVAVNGVGFDVVKDADDVRKKIGIVTEKLVAYDRLTPLKNLRIFGRLYEMDSTSVKQRSEELLKLVDLWEFRKTRALHKGAKAE